MRVLTAAIYLLCWFTAPAAKTILVTDETKKYELFADCERLIFDLKNDPGISNVLHREWLPADQLQLNQKNTRSAYYLKTSIQNNLDLQLLTHIYYVSLGRTSIYQVLDGEIIASAHLGVYSIQEDFPFLHSYPMLELKNTNGKPFDIIMRIEGVQTAYLSWFVSATKPLFATRHLQDLFYGFIYGLFLLIVFYNLSLYYRLRELDNLIYALWIMFLAIHLAFFNGFIYEFILPDRLEGLNLVDVVAGITSVLHIIFAVIFLKIRWNKLGGRIALIIILWYAASVVVTISGLTETFFPWMNPVFIVMFEGLYCLVMGIRALAKGFKPALYFVMANVLFYIFIGIVISYGTGNSNHSFIGYHGFQIGSALEVIFFSFGLSYKVRLLKRQKDDALEEKTILAIENEKILREQNVILEQKVEERTHELQREKMRSDELLLNILPEQTAQELKDTGKSVAKRFENVTILFADFVGFTTIAENLPPEEIVTLLDQYFRAFDEIIEKHGLEKIKTIGDAYMAAGGLYIPQTSEPADMVKAALEMREYIYTQQSERQTKNLPAFEMRVGIHTGTVVTGIVGLKKFQYDIWGDTVNTASRMESHGEIGKINISQATYELIKDDPQFKFESRGIIDVKGKGAMQMWFVSISEILQT